MAPGPGDTDDGDGEWRFSLSDIEARNDEGGTDSDDADDGGGNVAGSFGPAETIEAGEIDAENALFVLVGVALAVLAVAGFAAVFP
jgi:hypothetical protein